MFLFLLIYTPFVILRLEFVVNVKAWILYTCYIFQVTYQTELFLEKNKDYVIAEHQALLNASKCSFVSGLFPTSNEESSKQSKFSSIGSRFKARRMHLFLSYLLFPLIFAMAWSMLNHDLCRRIFAATTAIFA